MDLAQLARIFDAVASREGWDFSVVNDDRDPIPWDYESVVRSYLGPQSNVLDIGTGGGERLLSLASNLGQAVGVDLDPAMIATAGRRLNGRPDARVTFEVADARSLGFADRSFDVVLNRHCTVSVPEVARVLKPDGVFVTQQVGANNTRNVCDVFGCGVAGERPRNEGQTLLELMDGFTRAGLVPVAWGEYDVPYYFCDLESFVFWLRAIPMPNDIDVEKHGPQILSLIERHTTPRGIGTNEHRYLLVCRRPAV